MKRFFALLTLLVISHKALLAQTNDSSYTVDFSRSLFHDRLDKAQDALIKLDGKDDNYIDTRESGELSSLVTSIVTTRVDAMQKQTELNENISHARKLMLLRGTTELLQSVAMDLRKKNITWSSLPLIYYAFEKSLAQATTGKSIYSVVNPLPFMEARIIASNIVFSETPGVRQVQELIFLKFVRQYPGQAMRQLSENPNYSFTDSLIAAWARKRPEEIITYAQARNSVLGQRIAKHEDPLVKEIVRLAYDKSGQLYFPFLEKISKGETTKEAISLALRDSTKYYSLLVNTMIDFAGRMQKGDTPVSVRPLQEMLRRKSLEIYVNTINGLHDLPNPVRFRKIQQLTPEELYYLIVMNETEIYTSSYVYVYNRMFDLMPVKSSDSLLAKVNNDRYKKFLTMASNYNTLDDFLSKMSEENATVIMKKFVDNLDKGEADDIEDAVDVANAYASITRPSIRQLMLKEVEQNLLEAQRESNTKGQVIYRIERLIMQSRDSQIDSGAMAVNISDSLGIPPVYEVNNNWLRDTSGRIILQMFFYGDEGGKGSFNHFVGLYNDRRNWSMKSTPQWVQFTSVNTKVPVILFANRALDEEKDLDEEAQRGLIEFMETNNYLPSITVHRGHSYYLPYTIEKMMPSKVVVLGSCGAYHNLANVLKTSPDAAIIASKQVGYGNINNALYTYLVDKLKAGEDVKWPTMVNDVITRISPDKREGFEDYIFPHQNLGALFIKAYRLANGKS